jgi:DNA polymerase III subunit epsilon
VRSRRVNRPSRPGRATRRASWRVVEFAALDFETTGLEYATDAIVSFGVIPVLGGRATLADSVHQLVRPDVPPSPRSQMVHLMRPQDLADEPPIEDVRDRLRASLDGRYVLAWFAQVEVVFLRRTFGGTQRWWNARTIDVRNLAIAVDREPREVRAKLGYGLSSVAKRYGVPVASPHEAYDDALVTAQLFLVLVGKLPDLPHPTAGDLLRLGRP